MGAFQSLLIGTKEGKDGIEARMHDQMKAREMLAKTFKLYDDSTSVNDAVAMAMQVSAAP